MKVIIEINTDNAAFEGYSWGTEISRILADVGRVLETFPTADHYLKPGGGFLFDRERASVQEYSDSLFDSNGNRVGTFKVLGD